MNTFSYEWFCKRDYGLIIIIKTLCDTGNTQLEKWPINTILLNRPSKLKYML